MSKYILTGCSTCLKSSIGESINSSIHRFVRSDSNYLNLLRSNHLINWEFLPRILMRNYLISSTSDLWNNVIFERGPLDQLVYCKLLLDGWFDLDSNGDKLTNEAKNILLHKDVYDSILKLEHQLNITNYIIIKFNWDDLIKTVISSESFYDSPRSDTYTSVEEYHRLSDKWTSYYIDLLNEIHAKYTVINSKSHYDSVRLAIEDLSKKTREVM